MPKCPTFPNLPQPSPNQGGKVLRTFPKPPPIGGMGKVCTPASRKHPKNHQPSPTWPIQIETLPDLLAALQTGYVFTTPRATP